MIDEHTAIASLGAWCAVLTLLMLFDFLGKVAASARRRRINPFTAEDMQLRMQRHVLALEKRIDRLDKLTTERALAPNLPLAPAIEALQRRVALLEDFDLSDMRGALIDHGRNIETLALARDALSSRITDVQELIGQRVGDAS